MKTLILLSINLFCILTFSSCERRARMLDIKLLLLTPEGFYDQPIVLTGKVKDIGPGGLWFVLEDKTAFIQVTTENITHPIPCVEKNKNLSIIGKLQQYENHKYFSYSSLLRCHN